MDISTDTLPRRRWLILALGMMAQASTLFFAAGLIVLVPTFESVAHLSLAKAELIATAPGLGMVLTLVAWGAAADRFGERVVISTGLALAGGILLCQLAVHSLVGWLVIFTATGAAGASVNAASGRIVLGWFAPHERGLAMGARQMSQPLGQMLAGLLLPWLALRHGLAVALVLPAIVCIACAVVALLFIADPKRMPNSATSGPKPSPYRGPMLWRIHAASALASIPLSASFALATVYLHAVHHWSLVDAGRFFAGLQVSTALVRLAAGKWSDRVGTRLRPVRTFTIATIVMFCAFAACQASLPQATPYLLFVAAIVSASSNGLAFASVAENAGPSWAGRALGVQNTGQVLTGAGTGPFAGDLVDSFGYARTFVVMSVFAVAAAFVFPVRSERTRRPIDELSLAAQT